MLHLHDIKDLPVVILILHAQTMSNHRITECPSLEGTSRIIKLQPPCHRQGHQPLYFILDQAAQGPTQPGLEHLQGQDISLGSLFQHLTTRIVKNFLLTSNLNLLSFNLKPFESVANNPFSCHIAPPNIGSGGKWTFLTETWCYFCYVAFSSFSLPLNRYYVVLFLDPNVFQLTHGKLLQSSFSWL